MLSDSSKIAPKMGLEDPQKILCICRNKKMPKSINRHSVARAVLQPQL